MKTLFERFGIQSLDCSFGNFAASGGGSESLKRKFELEIRKVSIQKRPFLVSNGLIQFGRQILELY